MTDPITRLNAALEGRYRVGREIGEGGMATVYLAEDLRHERKVALKVLKPELAAVVGGERFLAEIQTTANLQHPHILPLFDSGEEDGFLYYVMPYVEGESLRDRIDREKQLPVEESLRIASDIAEALDHAHRHGVVHRDIKPANILLTDGRPLIADFGIALAVAQAGGGRVTETGLSVGTPHYMSPEQATGDRDVDPRTDVYALGCVLYEMLIGEPPYSGTTAQAVLGKIIQGKPISATEARGTVPPNVDAAIRKALEKLPADRFGSARELAGALADPGFQYGKDAGAAAGLPASRRRTYAAAAVGLLIGVVAVGAAVLFITPRNARSPQRLSIVLPPDRPVAIRWWPGRSLAISPDGRDVVYASFDPQAGDPWANSALSVRSSDSPAVRELPGTARARQPFFSPDGEWVGFFTDAGELRKVPLGGGSSVPLTDAVGASTWAFGSWTDEGTIVFSVRSGDGDGGLRLVSADGGSSESLTLPDTAQSEQFHSFPDFVRGTGTILFEVEFGQLRDQRIDAVRLDTGVRSVVLENAGSPHYLVSGHLLFQRDGTLLVAPFDASRLALTGPAVPLVDEVRGPRKDGGGWPPELAVSRNGTLAYLPAVTGETTLGVVDRDGRFEALGSQSSGLDSPVPRVSPDGRYVAYVVSSDDVYGSVYIHDLERGTTNRLTQEGSLDHMPAWHPNGRELAVSSETESGSGIFLKDLAGSERLLVPSGDGVRRRNASWSPNGELLAYTVQDGTEHDIWILSMAEEGSPRPLLEGPESEHTPRFSPNGRWLAYVSEESGQPQVYVRGYPEGETFTVSTDLSMGPVWGPEGDELFYYGLHERTPRLIVVSVTDEGEALRLGTPTPLLEMRLPGPMGEVEEYRNATNFGPDYDVLPDGRGFVMVRGPGTPLREIILVQNFFEELRQVVPD